MLRRGGSAVPTPRLPPSSSWGLVEPQSSGLGGGAFLMHWDNKTKSLEALDGRETAPASPQNLTGSSRAASRCLSTRPLSPASASARPASCRLLEAAHRTPRQAAVGRPVRAGDQARPRRLPGLAAALLPAALERPGAISHPPRAPTSSTARAVLGRSAIVLKNPQYAATLDRASPLMAPTRSIPAPSPRRSSQAVKIRAECSPGDLTLG